MATKRFTTDDIINAVFDSDFGISNGTEEDGEEVYVYSDNSVFDRRWLHGETRRLMTSNASESNNNC